MPQIEIKSCILSGDDYAIRGEVDGRGYIVSVPRTVIDKAVAKGDKQAVAARALLAEDTRVRPVEVDIKGMLTL